MYIYMGKAKTEAENNNGVARVHRISTKAKSWLLVLARKPIVSQGLGNMHSVALTNMPVLSL